MSVLFGSWQFDGRPVDRDYIDRLESQVARFGPDARGFYSLPGITLGYRAFDTTPAHCRSQQPYVAVSGAIVTWDGRLDNRNELAEELGGRIERQASDVAIVAAAYSAWEIDCLPRFVGDWALVIWDPACQRLLLGADFVGARRLYYKIDSEQVNWSTILDPLVLDSEQSLSLCEPYLAGWLSGFPRPQLTPYAEIKAVAPATSVSICNREKSVRKYWDFDPRKTTRYRCDGDYEDKFRLLFTQAVRRRLSSDWPVLAELSGGMDSSSIVCMADRLIGQSEGGAPRLDTVSYYCDSEPSWDDQPYFRIVEEMRRRVGCHIEVGQEADPNPEPQGDAFSATPSEVLRHSQASSQFSDCVLSQCNRVLLSGIGGDEVLGGVPTPIPELADLLAECKVWKLFQRALGWALVQRKPVLHLLYVTSQEFLPSSVNRRAPVWLAPRIAATLPSEGARERIRFFGAPPSFQQNLIALDTLRKQLALSALLSNPLLDTRYPYLDRDLLEFLFSIPREQIIRPGQRRSLMRRALRGTVPDQVLNRKRKAFAVRTPLAAVSACWTDLTAREQSLVCEELGLIDRRRFSKSLCEVLEGNGGPLLQLSRTLILELWLRRIRRAGVLGSIGKITGESEVLGVTKLS